MVFKSAITSLCLLNCCKSFLNIIFKAMMDCFCNKKFSKIGYLYAYSYEFIFKEKNWSTNYQFVNLFQLVSQMSVVIRLIHRRVKILINKVFFHYTRIFFNSHIISLFSKKVFQVLKPIQCLLWITF